MTELKDLIGALKFYEKQVKDLKRASENECQNFKNSTLKRKSALARKVSICSESKEKAFWYVIGVLMESEFYNALKDVNSPYVLENIKSSLGRYPSYFQAIKGEHLRK